MLGSSHHASKIVSLSLSLSLPACLLVALGFDAGRAIAQTQSAVIERGQDFAVHERMTPVASVDGQTRFRMNRFTLLENGLHYQGEDGEWKESRDLIEPFPEGAIARYGPNQAVFSPDLNAAAVFDIQMADGGRLRGGVRAIQLTDWETERSLVLGTVKDSVPGELIPPDRIVYRDAFDGLEADVVLVWRHNLFSHDVVIRQRPALPEGWNPATVRLEVLTELVECPDPEVRRQTVAREGEAPLEDDVVLGFGGMDMLMGHGFPVAGEAAWAFGGLTPAPEATPVLKQYHELPDGRRFLVESVAWADAEAGWKTLPRTAGVEVLQPQPDPASGLPRTVDGETRLAAVTPPETETSRPADPSSPSWRAWPQSPSGSYPATPMLLAQADYEPSGYVVDFHTIPTDGIPTTFVAGQTYYIKSSYYSGSSVTFQPGCTIKFKHNAYLLLYGPMSFPNTLQTPVFTSKDDNGFGEIIAGVPGEVDSDGDPTNQKASKAIWVYYVNSSTTLRNVRVRHAQRGIQYDVNPGVYITHNLQKSLLEHCDAGVYANLANATLMLTSVEKNDVTTAIACSPYGGCGTIYGSITQAPFYTEKSFRGLDIEDGLQAVPDTMGAIGPNSFIATTVKGNVVVFNRETGERIVQEELSDFMDIPQALDPRVLFDNLDGENPHWVISAFYSSGSDNRVVVMVSLDGNPGLNPSDWRRFNVPLSLASDEYLDFPTLGADGNGVYVSVQVRAPNLAQRGYRIQAFKKPDVYTNANYQLPAPLTITPQELDTWCIQPAYNFDGISSTDPVWFVAKGPSNGNQGGAIYYRRLQWSQGTPSWMDPQWRSVDDTYRDYYDIPQASTFSVANSGGSLGLGDVGSRMMNAVVRTKSESETAYLWTCHHVGLDAIGGNYDGYPGWYADRAGIQWFRFTLEEGGLTYDAHGRIYDSDFSTPYSFHFPSLNVNSAGDLLLGFSGSEAFEHISGFYHARKADGTWMARPVLAQAGRGAYTSGRWGDYSATSIDPDDGSFWTVQEYLDEAYTYWGTWVTQIKKAP